VSDPKTLAFDAAEKAVDALEEASGLSSLKQAKAENEALEAFATAVAEQVDAGLQPSELPPIVQPVAKESDVFTKTQVQETVRDAIQATKTKGAATLDEEFRKRLEKVKIMQTTDHKQGTTYRWVFPEGTYETRTGKDGREHFDWQQLRNTHFEVTDVNAAEPSDGFRGGAEWRDFMVNIIDEKGEKVQTTGPRTEAVNELANFITDRTAFSTPRDMIVHSGVGIEVEAHELPEWWAGFRGEQHDTDRVPPETRVVRVPLFEVNKIADKNEISLRGLQTELDARGYTLEENGGGVSARVSVNGRRHAYWEMSSELALPEVWLPAPDFGVGAAWKALQEANAPEQEEEEEEEQEQEDDDGFKSYGGSE
jgi:hypothetical protein